MCHLLWGRMFFDQWYGNETRKEFLSRNELDRDWKCEKKFDDVTSENLNSFLCLSYHNVMFSVELN